jgi:hypothetical protein
MTATLAVTVPITYTCPGFEPVQSAMSVTWNRADPAALTLVFQQPDDGGETTWIVGRDVFADCLLSEPGPEFGGGDITLERGVVSMFLTLRGQIDNSEWYEAGITFLTAPVLKLVQASLMYVPRGEVESETLAAELDSFLSEVLG